MVTKKNNLLIISLFSVFIFGIILYLILKPKSNKSSTQGGEIQPIMIDSETLRPGVFPKTLRPGVFSETLRPGVSPETLRPGVFPEKLRPGVFPEKLRPGVFPETLRPGVFPETLRPGVFPETLRPGVFPETLRPGVFPERLRPNVFPEILESYVGSYIDNANLTIKISTKYTGKNYYCDILLYDLNGNFLDKHVIINPVPLSSPEDGYVYITVPKDELPNQEIKFYFVIFPFIEGDTGMFNSLDYTSGQLITPQYIPDSIPIVPQTTKGPVTTPNPLKPIPQKVEGYGGSYVNNNNLTVKLLTKYTGEDYVCRISLYDLNGNTLKISYRVNPVPNSSKDGYVYITVPEDSIEKTPLPTEEILFYLYIYNQFTGDDVFYLSNYTSNNGYVKPRYGPPSNSICINPLIVNSSKDDCCYKGETTIKTCRTINDKLMCTYKDNISSEYNCCNGESNVPHGTLGLYDVVCK